MNPQPSDTSPGASTVLAFIAMTLVCMAVVIVICVRLAERLEPGVGDIAEFTPGHADGSAPAINVTARQADRACVIASDVVARSGGSLVVVARQATRDPSYLIHWVGPRTNTGATDCGSSADLLVSKRDLLSLVGVAGGFGLHPERQKAG